MLLSIAVFHLACSVPRFSRFIRVFLLWLGSSVYELCSSRFFVHSFICQGELDLRNVEAQLRILILVFSSSHYPNYPTFLSPFLSHELDVWDLDLVRLVCSVMTSFRSSLLFRMSYHCLPLPCVPLSSLRFILFNADMFLGPITLYLLRLHFSNKLDSVFSTCTFVRFVTMFRFAVSILSFPCAPRLNTVMCMSDHDFDGDI